MRISQKKRKIGYTYGSVSGVFPFRGKKNIQFESTLERDLLMIMEYDPCVTDVIEQPVTIEYTNKNGREVTYTPDFLVHYHPPHPLCNYKLNVSKLIEVKPNNLLKKNWLAIRPKLKIGTAHARQQGWIFCIYDESRIRSTCLDNINFLKRHRNHQYDAHEELRIINYITKKKNVSVEKLLKYLYSSEADKRTAKFQIWHLLSKHKLLCDMGRPLNITTTIWNNTH